MNTYVYTLGDGLYINLTNRCTNACEFCLRQGSQGVGGSNLWIDREPEVEEVMEQFDNYNVDDYQEIVFCGFGEPMMRLEVLLDAAAQLKERYPDKPLRINTNGQANLYYGEDITPRLEGLIDELSISLNTPTAEEYQAICHSRFKEAAFEGLLDFAVKAKRYVPKVKLSVVDVIGEDKVKLCQKVANERGIDLKVRAYIE